MRQRLVFSQQQPAAAADRRWAWVYRFVGAIHGLEASLYFSGITFTTVGYGDITLAKCWQLLSVGEAVNGVLMAGWSTALLIVLVQKMMTFHLHIEAASPGSD
jgi:voltage-gated potassium channel Kch